jgi:hypothetical protein
MPSAANFKLVDTDMPVPKDGEILVSNWPRFTLAGPGVFKLSDAATTML